MDGTYVSAPDEITAQVVTILATQALREPTELAAETSLESLGIDSLGMAEILFAIEETFDLAVPFNANEPGASMIDLRSVGSVCAAVAALIQDQKG